MPKKWMKTRAEMEKVLEEADFGFLGMSQEGKPYVIPMSFAYRKDKIFLHAALKGLKLDHIRNNPHVCFTVAEQQEIVPDSDPCNFSVRYRSVVVRGRAKVMEGIEEKTAALNVIAAKYARGKKIGSFDPRKVVATAVIVIKADEITGKFNTAD